MKYRQNIQRIIGSILTVGCLVFAVQASAAWNPPSCNPDDVGPTDPSCNVYAPLNTHSVKQTKTGSLLIFNMLSAADLTVSSAIAGFGRVTISGNSGETLLVTHNDATEAGVVIQAATSNDAMRIKQPNSGRAVEVRTSNDNVYGVSITAGASNPFPVNIQLSPASFATGISIDAGATGTGLVIASSGRGIEAHGLKYGIEAIGVSGGKSANFHSSTIAAATEATNDAGGRGLDAKAGGVDPSAITTDASIATVGKEGLRATSDSSYGVIGYTTGNASGAGVVGLADDDYGVIGWSSKFYGMYGNTEYKFAYGGMFCNTRSNCAIMGMGESDSATMNGRVRINDKTNIAVDSTYNTLTVLNASSTGGGVEVFAETGSLPATTAGKTSLVGKSYSETGVFAYSQTGTGLRVEGDSLGEIFGDTLGAEVIPGSGGVGINIATGASSDALFVNQSIVHNEGAFEGGVFHSFQHPSNGIHRGVDSALLDMIDAAPLTPSSIIFDGSDIWISSGAFGKVQRYNAVDGRFVHEYAMAGSLVPNTMYYLESKPPEEDKMYVFGANGNYQTIRLWEANPSSAVFNIGVPERIESVVHDGHQFWLTTNGNKLYTWMPGTLTFVQNLVNPNVQLVYADNAVWVPDSSNDRVLKFNASTRALEQTITGITTPVGMTFDGQYIWTTHSLDRLARINVSNYAVETVDISGLGSQPWRLLYDGKKIWMPLYGSGRVGSFDIGEYLIDQFVVTDAMPQWIAFDGTNVWVTHTGGKVAKIGTGSGFGQGETPVTNGKLVWGQDGVLYCVYVDNTGTLANSPMPHVNCQ
ncbi:MAG: hypothetical protein ABIG66_00100 [Candidatus Kerfeldbacteria bacterium]